VKGARVILHPVVGKEKGMRMLRRILVAAGSLAALALAGGAHMRF
jgi:hypothetical protein